MARNIFIGNAEKAENVKNLYIGVDGKAQKIQKAYIGVDGIAQQFYPVYVWNRYVLNSSSSWGFTSSHLLSQSTPERLQVADSKGNQETRYVLGCIMDENKAIDIVRNNRVISEDDGYRFSAYSDRDRSDYFSNNQIGFFITVNSAGISIINPVSNSVPVYKFMGSNNRGAMFFIETRGTMGWGWNTYSSTAGSMYVGRITKRYNYSQGTYIDQVYSDNPSAYPSNGHDGQYWYVAQF